MSTTGPLVHIRVIQKGNLLENLHISSGRGDSMNPRLAK